MDWTNVAIILGSNFFVAASSVSVGVVVPFMQMRRELEGEKRARKREARSEPLLRLRGEVASFGAKMASLLALKDSPRHLGEYQKILGEIFQYMVDGELKKTSYSLGEKEFMTQIADLMAIWSRQPLPTEQSEIAALIYSAEQKIVEIESLINKRLEEL